MNDTQFLPLAGIDAAILVGSLGARLRGVVDPPLRWTSSCKLKPNPPCSNITTF
ncbi:MAG: hypothetical protein ACOVLK_08725 [Terrimicrobiaceae bacterium]